MNGHLKLNPPPQEQNKFKAKEGKGGKCYTCTTYLGGGVSLRILITMVTVYITCSVSHIDFSFMKIKCKSNITRMLFRNCYYMIETILIFFVK